ncbi:hypothetical protein SO802_029631 [Lithocarpus litseifolius]|uniref:Uncharacterized protein n=1 Tax=Lithocarpus litseifolius TaxID=425828 RepID=A0AAW2BVU2_9ROSI
MIVAGSKWKIGDDECIGVTTHKWLSHVPIFNGELDPKLKWDRGKVHALFTARTRNEILALPLNDTQTKDSFIWMENRSKTFLVKTTYHVALRLMQQQVVEHSKAQTDKPTWKKL